MSEAFEKDMKSLGKFNIRIANEYKKILSADGIEVKFLVTTKTGYPYIGSIDNGYSMTGVYVSQESYDKAKKIIEDFEKNQLQEIDKNSEKLNLIYPRIMIMVGILLLFLFCMFYKQIFH